MAVHFHREVDRLKQRLLSLGGIVETRLHSAVQALHERRREQALMVIDGDAEVDRAEVDIEEECLKILALHQPVAGDLRFIVAVMKINNDLERIGDLSVNVARKAAALAERPDFAFPFDLQSMSRRTEEMVRMALDSLVHLDSQQARRVCRMDEEVNNYKRQARRQAVAYLQKHPEMADPILRLLGACRNLERVADMATNIAEDVVYLVEGQILRHQPWDREAEETSPAE